MKKSPMRRAAEMNRKATQRRRAKVTAEERACRKIVRERSREVCEVCGRAPATNMHHRKKAGRKWTPSNVLHVCGMGNVSGCHGRIESFPDPAKEQGWWLLPIQDPAHSRVWLAGRGYCLLADTGEIQEIREAA